jgi:hypothetical protein
MEWLRELLSRPELQGITVIIAILQAIIAVGQYLKVLNGSQTAEPPSTPRSNLALRQTKVAQILGGIVLLTVG